MNHLQTTRPAAAAAERLPEQAARFRMLFEQATDAIFVVSADMRMEDVNEAACRLLGYAHDELLGVPVRDIIHPDSLVTAPLRLPDLATGEVVRSTRTLVRKDGTTVEVEVRAKSLGDGGFQAVATEVGDRLRYEQELLRHALMFDTLLDGVIFADAEGRITDWNPAAARMYGYTREEVVGRQPTFLQATEEAASVLESILTGVASEGHWTGEIEFLKKDGTRGTSETVIVAVRDPEGSIVGSIGVNRDVTERKRATAEIAAINRQRDLVLRSAGEGIWGLDTHGRTAFVNPAAERMLGWPAEELLGKSSHDLTHHTRADGSPYPRDECPIHRALRDGSASRVDDEVFWRKDGSSFPVSYTSTPILEDGAVAGVVVVFRDISEQRALEEQLRQSQKIEAIGRLAGGIAHDFNNLLTAIGGYTDLLLQTEQDDAATAYLGGIQDAADRAAALTRQLLAFTRQQVLEPVVLDVNAAVEETRTLLRRLIPESVRVVSRLDDSIRSVRADPMQVTQVLLNLAVNARDAMPDGGQLTIATAPATVTQAPAVEGVDLVPGEYVRISVTDTGTGMTADVAARAFDPFFTTKPVGEGTGLGLATVYGIVKQSGGYVFVQTAPGRGSTFDVYLPATGDRPRDAEAPVPTAPPEPSAHGRVLLVEDEDVVRELLQEALRGRGYDVVASASGDQALASLASDPFPFDVVVTDVVMPGTSGREVAAAVRAAAPRARVVYMSGYARDIVDDEALDADTSFLQKPFAMRDLVAKVDELLAQHAA